MQTTIRSIMKISIAVLLAISLGACATRLGRDFDDGYATQIKPGETTKADVHKRLGRPALVNRTGDEDMWTYSYYEGSGVGYEFRKLFGGYDPNNPNGGRQKRLVVTFKGDTVKASNFKQEFPLPDPLEEAYR